MVETAARTRFTLKDAETITSFSVADLQNHIKRGILKYLGRGGAGRPREFSIVGMYEIGVVEALTRAGLTLVQAANVVHYSLISTDTDAFAELLGGGTPAEEAALAIEEQPDMILRGEWADEPTARDLASPFLWVFLLDATTRKAALIVEVAKGWADVPRAAREAIALFYRAYRMPPDAPSGPIDEAQAQIAEPHVHVFNISAVLRRLDCAVQELLQAV